jgi:hypothetical protein
MPSLEEQVARAIVDCVGGASHTPGDDDYKAAVAAIRVVQDTIDPHSKNWQDGWNTRDAENAVVQQEERARVLAEAQHAIHEAFTYKATNGDGARIWAERRALKALTALAGEQSHAS